MSHTGDLSALDFIERSLASTEQRLAQLGLEKDTLLDPEESYDRQVAVLRYNYLLGERSAVAFGADTENFWRMLRARLQPMILAYLTHEKFIQSLEGDALERKAKEMMEVYRERLSTTEQFKQLFFELNEEQRAGLLGTSKKEVQQAAAPGELHDSHKHYDASGGIADIQANVINQLKESLKDQERAERRLQKQLTEKDEQLYRHEKTIERLEQKQHELLEEIERLSTENLQLKISIDASHQDSFADSKPGEPGEPGKPGEPEATPEPQAVDIDDLADASKEELILKIESLERDLQNTSSAAYSAFMANSDLGIVVLFMLTAFKTQTINRLGQEVGRSLKTYGLSSVFRVKSETSTDFFSQDKVSDKAKMTLKNNEGKGRFVDLGREYLIYDERTAILVTDMPTDDEERRGRLKDNLNTLMQGAETSANLIALSQSAEMQKQRMEALLVRSNAVFDKLAKNLERNKAQAMTSIKRAGGDLRTQLKISPGGPGSNKLNAALRDVERTLEPLFVIEKLVDAAFMKNVARVVEGLKKGHGP